MNAPSFLQVPIRLRHQAPDFLERLTRLGMLCVRAKNLTAELVAIADPGETVFVEESQALFPALGLSLATSRIAGVHAIRVAQLPDHSGMLEMDFEGGHFPLGFALPDELHGTARLRELVASFCAEEIGVEGLLQWRASLAEPFQACPCCQAAAEQRREHPEFHPLSAILADVVDFSLPLHCRLTGGSFEFSRFLDARRLSCQGALTVCDESGDCVLRIDPAYAHALWVLPVLVDGESRTTVRVYDTLGSMNLELSVVGDAFVGPWQRYCAAACS